MVNGIMLTAIATAYLLLFRWAFRTLPHDGWQFWAAVPQHRDEGGRWYGMNLTYYGLLTASAVTIAVLLVIVLLGSVGLALSDIVLFVVAMLALTVPAAKVIAAVVERKPNTLTIAGASCVGLLCAPWVIVLLNRTVAVESTVEFPMFGALAALTIAYAFGEGTGRLACISFGCCYGKPLAPPRTRWERLLHRWSFSFSGETKKAVYEGRLECVPLVPIQAITAVLYVAGGLVASGFFLEGGMMGAFLTATLSTQVWRVVSESWRADHRGDVSGFSVYQRMALVLCGYAVALGAWLPAETSSTPDLAKGLNQLWHPGLIMTLQSIWLVIFLFTGRSRVTAAQISFSVAKDGI